MRAVVLVAGAAVPGRAEGACHLVNHSRCTSVVGLASTPSRSGTTENYRRTLEALNSRSRRPKRWLGQNYMVNENVNEELVKAADVQAGDLVLEIGPGTGSLTDALLRAGAYVIAVEKDPDMASLVSERFKGHPRVQVHQDDVLKWHVRLHLIRWMESIGLSKPVKVVSNLPFNITSDVLKTLLPMGDIFSHVVLLLQEEAAARFVDDTPTVDEYRSMSIFIRFFSAVEFKFKVDRCNFFPRPPVNGAVLSFRLKKASEYPRVFSVKGFFTLVQSAFNSKRKMLRASLRHLYTSSAVESALGASGIDGTARPHQLALHEFVALYNALAAIENVMDGQS